MYKTEIWTNEWNLWWKYKKGKQIVLIPQIQRTVLMPDKGTDIERRYLPWHQAYLEAMWIPWLKTTTTNSH